MRGQSAEKYQSSEQSLAIKNIHTNEERDLILNQFLTVNKKGSECKLFNPPLLFIIHTLSTTELTSI